MKKQFLSTLLVMMMVFAAACTKEEAAPQPSEPANAEQPAPTEQPEPTDEAATEEDIAPVPDPSADAEAVKDTITFFFADNDLMGMYRVKQEVEAATREELPLAALKKWIEGPSREELNNLVPPGVVIESVEMKDDIAYVSLSSEVKYANLGSTGELYLIDQIAQLMSQFGYDQTQLLVAGQVEESLLGHVTTNIPVSPTDPEQYEWLE